MRALVYCLSVAHAKRINQLLVQSGIRSRAIFGDSGDDRKEAINDFLSSDPEPMVLCLFNVLTTGFDAPNADAAFIARPVANRALYWQMVGRVIRGPKMGGTPTADVFTVMDPGIPGLESIVSGFEAWEEDWKHE